MKIFYILLLTVSFLEQSESYIRLPLTIENQLFLVNLELGSTKSKISLLLDLTYNTSWISNYKSTLFYGYTAKNFSAPIPSQSSSYYEGDFTFFSRKEFSCFTGSGTQFNDSLFLGSNQSILMNFFNSDNFISDKASNGILGLDKGEVNFDNLTVIGNNYSFIERLYQDGFIDQKIFSIRKISDNNFELVLGADIESNNYKQNYSSCNISYSIFYPLALSPNDPWNSHWSCHLSRFFVGGLKDYFDSIIISKQIVFSSTTNGIIISSAYMNFFTRYYFYGFPINQCISKTFGKTIFHMCLKKFNYNLLPVLNMEIGDWIYSFTYDQLFEPLPPSDFYEETGYNFKNMMDDFKEYNFFKIRFVDSPLANFNYTVMGINIFNDTIVFDKENNQVGFYYKNTQSKRDVVLVSTATDLLYYLIVFISIFFVLAILMITGFVIYLRMKNRREEKYKMKIEEESEIEDRKTI